MGHARMGAAGVLNVIYILYRAKCVPRQYNVWDDASGSAWAITSTKDSPFTVSAALIRPFLLPDLVRAQHHYKGKGIGSGIDNENAVRLLHNIEDPKHEDSKAHSYKFKCVLESSMAACSWPALRVNVIRAVFPTPCGRCGLEPEADLRVFWECPCH